MLFNFCLLQGTDAQVNSKRRAKRAVGSRENSQRLLHTDSEIPGMIRLKLGWMVVGMMQTGLSPSTNQAEAFKVGQLPPHWSGSA